MEKKPTSRYKSEFEDCYGVVTQYLRKFDFEDKEEFDYSSYYDSESDDEDYNHVINPHQTILKYVNQVRDSFGFDVDCCAPSWFEGSFVPINVPEAKRKKKSVYDDVIEAAKFGIREINAETCGKSFEFVDLEKAVMTVHLNWHLTISAKEVDSGLMTTIQAIVYEHFADGFDLEQWRIKPAPSPSPCGDAPVTVPVAVAGNA